jgi:hypothetical protein
VIENDADATRDLRDRNEEALADRIDDEEGIDLVVVVGLSPPGRFPPVRAPCDDNNPSTFAITMSGGFDLHPTISVTLGYQEIERAGNSGNQHLTAGHHQPPAGQKFGCLGKPGQAWRWLGERLGRVPVFIQVARVDLETLYCAANSADV